MTTWWLALIYTIRQYFATVISPLIIVCHCKTRGYPNVIFGHAIPIVIYGQPLLGDMKKCLYSGKYKTVKGRFHGPTKHHNERQITADEWVSTKTNRLA